jgi:thiol:disulfide interchange protein DsbD
MSEEKGKENSRAPMCTCRILAAIVSVAAFQVSSYTGADAQRVKDPSPHSEALLIPEVYSVLPGQAFAVGLKISLDPGWHSYWLNPGDAGQPTRIQWDIPAGYRAGELQWPFPQIVEESTVVSYGYNDELMLLTEITPPKFLSIGQTVRFAAVAHWLVCNNICLPATADLDFEIQISDQAASPTPRWREAFEKTRRNLPIVADSWRMSVSRSDGGFVLHIFPERGILTAFDRSFFFVSERGVLAHGAPQDVSYADGGVRISLVRSPYAREEPERLSGVLVLPELIRVDKSTTRAFAIDVAVPAESNER